MNGLVAHFCQYYGLEPSSKFPYNSLVSLNLTQLIFDTNAMFFVSRKYSWHAWRCSSNGRGLALHTRDLFSSPYIFVLFFLFFYDMSCLLDRSLLRYFQMLMKYIWANKSHSLIPRTFIHRNYKLQRYFHMGHPILILVAMQVSLAIIFHTNLFIIFKSRGIFVLGMRFLTHSHYSFSSAN